MINSDILFPELTYHCHLMRAGYLLLAYLSAFYIFRSVCELPCKHSMQATSFFLKCFLPLQLEAGIMSGDIESFNFVERAWKLIFPSPAKKKDDHHGNKKDSIGMVRIKELNNILGSWKLVQFNLDDLLLYLFQGARHDRRIPSAHESRERLRNSDIFKRKLDEPNEENQK